MASIDYELEWRPIEMRSLRLPSIRSNAAGAIMNQELVIFGGKGSNQFNEIWKFSSTKLLWEVIDAHGDDIPLPRDGHTLTKVSETEFYIFGGQGHVMGTKIYEKQTENGKAKCLSIRKLFDDMYSFNCETVTWSPLPRRKITPPGRRGHSMLFIPSNILSKSSFHSQHGSILTGGKGYLLLFGGSCVDLNSSVEKTNNDMWLFSLETFEWELVNYHGPSPLPLYGHCAEIIDHLMVVVGGNIAIPAPRKGSQGSFLPHTRTHTPLTSGIL
jgi:N-acetylneuraminic acid mutarotase